MSINNDLLQEAIQKLYDEIPENVHSVSYGYKIVDGETTNQLSIIFSVDKKIPASEVDPSDLLPSSITVDGQNISTDVISTTRSEALSNCFAAVDSSSSAHRQNYSSELRGGISTGLSNSGGAGTLGAIFLDKDDNSFIALTNAHVGLMNNTRFALANNIKSPSDLNWDISDNTSIQPATLDGIGTNIGQLKRYYPWKLPPEFNTIDAAIIGLNTSALTSLSSAKSLLGIDQANTLNSTDYFPFATSAEIDSLLTTQKALRKSGRSTGSNNANSSCELYISEINHTTAVDMAGVVLQFTNCLVMRYKNTVPVTHPITGITYNVPQQYAAAPGDSGSVVLGTVIDSITGVETVKVIGLLFAGGSYSYGPELGPNNPWVPLPFNHVVLCRIDEVSQKLNIDALSVSSVTTNEPSNWTYINKSGLLPDVTIIENDLKYWQAGATSGSDSVYVTYSSPTSPPAPSGSGAICGLHVTGGLAGGSCVASWVITAEQINKCFPPLKESNYIVPGSYASLSSVAPYAQKTTFDGIVIPSGFGLKVFKQPDFNGEVLLDMSGPAIINNVKWINTPGSGFLTNSWNTADPVLVAKYPPNVRFWSESDMHSWPSGSIIVTATIDVPECPPEDPPEVPDSCCYSSIETIDLGCEPPPECDISECRFYYFESEIDDESSDFSPARIGTCQKTDTIVTAPGGLFNYLTIVTITPECCASFNAATGPVRGPDAPNPGEPIPFYSVPSPCSPCCLCDNIDGEVFQVAVNISEEESIYDQQIYIPGLCQGLVISGESGSSTILCYDTAYNVQWQEAGFSQSIPDLKVYDVTLSPV
jgi:hypothetical protein